MSTQHEGLPILQAIKKVEDTLGELDCALKESAYEIKLNVSSELTPINRVSRAITSITYDDDQEGRNLVQLSGAVFISPQISELVIRVNNAKQKFADLLKETKASLSLKSSTAKSNYVRDLFTKEGYGRIHFKQVIRQLVVVEGVKSLSFYIESGGWGAQKKFTKKELLAHIETFYDRNSDKYDMVTKVINPLPDSEIFVQRSKSPDSQKVTVKYEDESSETKIATLPLFVVVESENQVGRTVVKNTPYENKVRNNGRTKFEEEPLIDPPVIYRYKEEFR